MGSIHERHFDHFDASLGRSVVSGDVMNAFENTHTERRAAPHRTSTTPADQTHPSVAGNKIWPNKKKCLSWIEPIDKHSDQHTYSSAPLSSHAGVIFLSFSPDLSFKLNVTYHATT